MGHLIVTIHPGPTLMVYHSGSLLVEVPLSPTQAQGLAIDLQLEAMRAQRREKGENVPMLDLPPVDTDETH